MADDVVHPMIPRPADPSETSVLTRLWHDGWQDAHAAILPPALARARTFEDFAERMSVALADVRVIGPLGAPLGFAMLKGDELNQFYVTSAARGTGVAATLIADAEVQMSQRGVETAWLACAIGNSRAAKFYEKSGWHLARTMVNRLDTVDGPFDLEIWRYEKLLTRG
ncbi:GNAT family N-acetyltransferase [Bradyrhizobium sp. JYMT SZCCT0180]|uniref:GNAT family N-acetyltransferase n=1 Tax=Bradyrhizobium sp. JYMT SZCCT0180 TaxID=2807666 RepID=UPI0020123223|nr:GNAT family N-acetyltransferase [Bradyrhizobium sp. JYMT SZCCT0180]